MANKIKKESDTQEIDKTVFTNKNTSFISRIPKELRIKCFLISYLRRLEMDEKQYPTFDEIIFHVMPLLTHVEILENQTIVSVLKEIAEPVEDCWRLKEGEYEKCLNYFV